MDYQDPESNFDGLPFCDIYGYGSEFILKIEKKEHACFSPWGLSNNLVRSYTEALTECSQLIRENKCSSCRQIGSHTAAHIPLKNLAADIELREVCQRSVEMGICSECKLY